MIRRRLQPLLLCLIVAMLPLLAGPPKTADAGAPGLYIALGDSIAAGVGSSLPQTRSYPALVHGWLETLNGTTLPYVNLGTPGETASSFISGQQWTTFQAEVARSSDAGLPLAAVTVSLGGNELLSVQGSGLVDRQAALDEFRTAYDEALGLIRGAIGPDVPFVVTTSYDATEGDVAQVFTDAWWIAQFNQVIRDAAARHGAGVADLEPLFEGRVVELTWYPVDVHPRNQGYLVIAEAVWRALAFDQVAPSVEIRSPATVTRSTPTLRVTATDNVAVTMLTITQDGSPLAAIETAPGEYVALLQIDPGGAPAHIEVEAGDAAGNVQRQEQELRLTMLDED